jgi:hypothetical protein
MSGVSTLAYLPHSIIHSVQVVHIKGRVRVCLGEYVLGQLHPCVITHDDLHKRSAWQALLLDALSIQRTCQSRIA